MRSKISPLEAEGAETVADHRFLPLLGYAQCTTDHLDRGGFFMRPGDRVQASDVQCANTISNRRRTDTLETLEEQGQVVSESGTRGTLRLRSRVA